MRAAWRQKFEANKRVCSALTEAEDLRKRVEHRELPDPMTVAGARMLFVLEISGSEVRA